MIGHPAGDSLGVLVGALLSLRPITAAMNRPVEIAPDVIEHYAPLRVETGEGEVAAFDLVAEVLGLPGFVASGEEAATGVFDRVATERIRSACGSEPLPAGPPLGREEFDRLVGEALDLGDVRRVHGRRMVTAPDGVLIPAYSSGDPAAPPVIIVPATGMPVELSVPWITALAATFHVMTWENRGLFPGQVAAGDSLGQGLDAQAGDLIAVLDAFGVAEAHVFGLCSGAGIALAAAAEHPERIGSISLWHGDFELGSDSLKTIHQRDLEALMTEVALGTVSAESVHATIGQVLLESTPMDLAHLVLYPYASPDLLHRYCQAISVGMRTDVQGYLPRIKQPALVVTSRNDTTAHPAGSLAVARELSGAFLHVAPEGDHLTLFRAAPELVALARDFVSRPLDRP